MLKLTHIKQQFPRAEADWLNGRFTSLLQSPGFSSALGGRKHLAVAVGSRGIANLSTIINQLTHFLTKNDFGCTIIPAMGSHGSATAEGQKLILNKLGITEAETGCEIASSMEVAELGKTKWLGAEYPAYFDRTAWETCDGVILVNRVKPHTDFTGKYESGLVKMLAVGLGNHRGAEQVHALGTKGLHGLMPRLAETLLKHDKIIGGLAIVEDAYHNLADIIWVDRKDILRLEPEILAQARSLMPRLPFDEIDFLFIKQMGKNISGAGIDPKIVGRMMIPGEAENTGPAIELIGVGDLTEASDGNALGVGLADFITKRLFNKIDFAAMNKNVLTSTFYQRGKIPLVLDTERQIVEVALSHCAKRGKKHPKIVVIQDTLNLGEIYVSEPVLDAIDGKVEIEILSEPKELKYENDNLDLAFS